MKRLIYRFTGLQKKMGFAKKKKLVYIFSRSPKVFRTRDDTNTLDHTRTRPFLLAVTRLVIEAGGSVAQCVNTAHLLNWSNINGNCSRSV